MDKENAIRLFNNRQIRVEWDADNLVENIQQYYDKLPDDIQAELPLKRIWIMVAEEE